MDRIGGYAIKRLIGEGGMGKVYEAEERLSKRRVALKVLRRELSRDAEGRRLFLDEMQILAHLEHPGLVRSLASLESEGQLVLVLEYLPGRTLRKELACRGRLPWDEAVEHAARIAEALSVAHTQEPPIVHRDLKPENVMLTVESGESEDAPAVGLKVMDFGVAKVLAGLGGTNTHHLGTLEYMSPEQIDAAPVDGRADLYALGLVLYEMIAGALPFASASPRELLNLQCTAAPPPLPAEVRRGLPRGVEDLVFALLEKKPADRPPSAAEVVAGLSPLRAASAATARAVTTGAGAPRGVSASTSASSSTPVAAREASPHEAAVGDAGNSGGEAPAVAAPSASSSVGAAPRMDTVALLGASRGRELPTWFAVVAIAALSVAAGTATYLVRVRALVSVTPAAAAAPSGADRAIAVGAAPSPGLR